MKTKMFSLLTVFAALALTACGEAKSEAPASESSAPKASISSSKGPTWGSWTVQRPATCGQEGIEVRYTTDSSNHEERKIAKLPQHTWLDDGDVEASEGGIAYKKVKCSVCDAKGIMIPTANATITGGTPKSAPEGCIKLNKDDDYMEIKFYLPEAKAGTIYQRGRMDYWYEDSNNNQERGYFSNNNGHTDEANGIGNFKLEIGLEGDMKEVSIADKTSFKFGDALPQDGGMEFGNHQWSAIGDCEIGAVNLAAGLNTIRQTRIDSFNLAVHDFTIVFAA